MSSTKFNTNASKINTNQKSCDPKSCENIVIYDAHSHEQDLEAEKEYILKNTLCEQCKIRGHAKAKCPKIPDNPYIREIKYQKFMDNDDHHGYAEYVSEQINKQYALMTEEEYEAHMDDVSRW